MHRRSFLKTLATGCACTLAGRALRPVYALQNEPKYPGLLDGLREKIHRWTESLWDPAKGGFRQNATIGVNLMSTTDVAWMRYAVNDPDLCGDHREAWVQWLQHAQNPDTGIVRYDPRDGGLLHSSEHGMWHTVRSLNILGAQLPHFPEYLRGMMTVQGIEAWFDSIDWEADPRAGTHHKVLGLVPLLVNLEDPAWTAAFYRKIVEQQSQENGCFPRCAVNVSRTFAYASLHRAVGRMPPHADKIVDTILSKQKPNGFWESQPAFHTMDATYLLVRLPSVLHHRQEDARNALSRLAVALHDYYQENHDRIHQETHRPLAIVHTFGLLQEAFPDRFPSERPYRFDWDKPSMYTWDVIRRTAHQTKKTS